MDLWALQPNTHTHIAACPALICAVYLNHSCSHADDPYDPHCYTIITLHNILWQLTSKAYTMPQRLTMWMPMKANDANTAQGYVPDAMSTTSANIWATMPTANVTRGPNRSSSLPSGQAATNTVRARQAITRVDSALPNPTSMARASSNDSLMCAEQYRPAVQNSTEYTIYWFASFAH